MDDREPEKRSSERSTMRRKYGSVGTGPLKKLLAKLSTTVKGLKTGGMGPTRPLFCRLTVARLDIREKSGKVTLLPPGLFSLLLLLPS